MKHFRQLTMIVLLVCSASLQAKPSAGAVNFDGSRLDNGIITVELEVKQGVFSIVDSRSKEVLLSNAAFRLPAGRPPTGVKVLRVEDVKDSLGIGKQVVLMVDDLNLLSYRRGKLMPSRALFTYTLYQDHPALILGFGMRTPNYQSLKVTKSEMLSHGVLFGGKPIEDLKTLEGSAGGASTKVTPDASRISVNSLMLTGLVDGARRSAVWGGLRYNEFMAVATLDNASTIGLWAEDPVGRLIDEDATWLAMDNYYVDVHTREPFEALERYGLAMRAANDAKPNVYNFPITCGWSVGMLSGLPPINNSASLVQELDAANAAGVTRYTEVSLRLEPDKYHGDTEQGWWDDARMQKFEHLVKPYETIAKWNEAMRAKHGIPYIYMQVGMPSDDFVKQYPQYMLFNDGSEVDRRTPRPAYQSERKHPHHQPYVTFDYTDREFSEYFVKTWRKLHQDGIAGVKVDYPATAWRPEGGFDDRYATTNSAYRRAFQLLREAFGKDGLIDERNIGESGRPCLDVTAGIVDTQRTWMDSNAFVPEMVSRSGLRWYKNRTVFNYYSDTKTVHKGSKGELESMLTMNFLTSGRLDLSSSYTLFTPEIVRAFSRTYPHYQEAKTARPLDAFTGIDDPQVYDLELTSDWRQIAFYNTGTEATVVSTAISGERVHNAIGLDPAADYHAYEFWSDSYLGKLSGSARLERKLEPNHCAMISLRKVTSHPQVISTDRHLLQGWVDLADVQWDEKTKTLSGVAKVIGGEPFKMVLADNGLKPDKAAAAKSQADLKAGLEGGLSSLTLTASETSEVEWQVSYH